jgi:hypothetical protein
MTYLGTTKPCFPKYSQKYSSFKFTNIDFCLFGITANNFLTFYGKVFFFVV